LQLTSVRVALCSSAANSTPLAPEPMIATGSWRGLQRNRPFPLQFGRSPAPPAPKTLARVLP
jgi:hypothetical protein